MAVSIVQIIRISLILLGDFISKRRVDNLRYLLIVFLGLSLLLSNRNLTVAQDMQSKETDKRNFTAEDIQIASNQPKINTMIKDQYGIGIAVNPEKRLKKGGNIPLKPISGESTPQGLKDNFSPLVSHKVNNTDILYEKVGTDGIKFKSSLYLNNDDNIFGYDAEGNPHNLATVQQNNIVDFGNPDMNIWIRAKDYYSIRAPRAEIVTQSNPDGTAAVSARELYHVGNMANHTILFASGGTQTLTRNAVNLISILDNNVSTFPVGNVSGASYTIPRKGVYMFSITAKVTAPLTAENSYLRFGIRQKRAGVNTDIALQDVLASNSYATPFLGANFMYLFNKGDVITPWIKPLNEDITIGAGSMFNIYYLGDSPSS
jgi:hypothetical protein